MKDRTKTNWIQQLAILCALVIWYRALRHDSFPKLNSESRVLSRSYGGWAEGDTLEAPGAGKVSPTVKNSL